MKTIIAVALGVLTSLCLLYPRPSHAQMGMNMCREGYVYETSRNVCVHKSKKAKAAKKKESTK
jgi:hypothetical protein